MIVAIHQPNFLPWMGYFYKIYKSDIFVFLDNVQFTKNGYQNRVKIKTSQGELWLTVPVRHKFGQLTSEVKFNTLENWREKHLKTLEMSYKRTPFFSILFDLLQKIYFKKDWINLSELNIALIEEVCLYLGITTRFVLASSLNVSGSSTNLLIDIVRNVGGNIYLSGRGGLKYQDEEKFSEHQIELVYTDFRHPVYPQLWGDFIEGLSIIDLIFNCGKDSLNYLRCLK